MSGSFDTVEVLVNGGAQVNAKAASGATAIRAAKKLGHSQIVKLLRDRGAKENKFEFLD